MTHQKTKPTLKKAFFSPTRLFPKERDCNSNNPTIFADEKHF